MAGADTTSIFLTAAVFLLLKNPDIMDKLKKEIRSTFKSEADITMTTASQSEYMLACLNEVFRICPVVTHGLPRVTEKGGTLIDGYVIPENVSDLPPPDCRNAHNADTRQTVVTVWQRAMHHDPRSWKDPMEFHPERWLGDAKYKDDRFEAMQPFSVGARDCIGRK